MPAALRVLLIDDNPDDRALALRALRKEFGDLEAVEVRDPESLAEALKPGRCDLAVVDYKLNWSTGLDLFPRLKDRYPHCPVIMFTATGNEEIAVNALKKGLDDYVLKSPRDFARLTGAATAALKRSRADRRARLMERRLQDLLARLDVGVFRATAKGRLLYANPAFCRLFGLDPARAFEDWDLYALLADPGDEPGLVAELKRAGYLRLPELKLRRADGKADWIALVQLQLVDGNGGQGVVEGLVEDISERKRLAAALALREEALRKAQKLESIGRLAGGVAHDFNNLLTAINGYSEILLEMMGEDNPFHEKILEIRKAGGRAAALTRQLLAFSRRQLLQPRLIDLNAVIENLDVEIRRTLGDANRLVLSLHPDPGKVLMDPAQFEHVILNLVQNAREAMPQGGSLLIETCPVSMDDSAREDESPGAAALRPGEYVMIRVTDTGTGMEPDVRARLFEPFFTTKSAGKSVGLGLSTAYGTVKQSGGEISVDSQVGRGSRFSIYLPRAAAFPATLSEPQTTLHHL